MKVWFHPESPYAQRVLNFLDWTGISAEKIPVSLENREHRSDAYLQVNPHGRVPAIWDNGFQLVESLAILRYLVERDGLYDWFPRGLQERAKADEWLEYVSQHACRPFLDLAWSRTMAARYGQKALPGVDEAAQKKLRRELPFLNERLGQSGFLVGGRPTLADVALYPFVGLSGAAGIDLGGEAPHLLRWFQQMTSFGGPGKRG